MLTRKIVVIRFVEKTTRDYRHLPKVGRDLKTGYFEIYNYWEGEHLRSASRETLITMVGNDTERGMTIEEAFDFMFNETPAQRSDVYRAVNVEREHQDKRWGGEKHDAQHPIGDYLTFMQRCLGKRMQGLCGDGDAKSRALNEIRQVLGLGVKAMEQHGIVERRVETDR